MSVLESNNKRPLVSIIVPCYNVEKYIEKGLESVYNQSFTNWECIIINDGSIDNTETEIQKWVKKDNRFKLISQKNKGLSGARNTGLKYVNGDCIYFYDPDDLLDKNCLINLTQLFNSDIDIIIGKSAQVYDQTTNVIDTLEHYNVTEKPITNKNFIEFSLKNPFNVVAWNKLYNTQFVVANELRFKDGIVHEDELWFFQTMSVARTIVFNSEITYYYNIGNQTSITKNYSLYNLKSYLTVIENIFSDHYVTEINEERKLIAGTYILKFQITVISAFFRFLKKNKNISFKKEGINIIKKHLNEYDVREFQNYDSKKSKQFELFLKYGKTNPESAFKLIRNTNKRNLLKWFENLYLRYTSKA